MKITAIRQQLRAASRYAVYVDERYLFSLSAEALLEAKIFTGQEVDAKEIHSLMKVAGDDNAYRLALTYLARRMHSRWELYDYLHRKGYDAELAGGIILKLERAGLVDDQAFAEAWVRNRRLLKPVSKRRLTQELLKKHVADEIIEQVLAEELVDERAVLRELITRRRRQTKYQDDFKLVQYLARQGFSYEDIKSVLAEQG